MEIKILGTGCSGCNALHETVKQALAELQLEATVIKEEELMQIMAYNVFALPALVVDQRVVSAGKRLSLAQVKELISQ